MINSRSENPSAASTSVTTGLPSVRVPVLSTIRVRIFSARSSATAFLTSTPTCAPRPVPTMMAVGVARPSAHGQAMTSTATAFTSAGASSPPMPHHSAKVAALIATTTGTNTPET